MSLLEVISWVSSAFIVFGGVIPYIPQYRDIKKTKSAEGFSPFVCLVLLIANILRILFWFGKRFEMPLLAQSFVMIAAMLLMMQLCVEVKNNAIMLMSRPRRLTDFDMKYFWKWTDFLSYIEFLLAFLALSGLVTYLLLDWPTFIEGLGFLSVFFEAMLGMPQLYKNLVTRSTAGMSVGMVSMWTVGDTLKTGYFLVKAAPAQFYICGLLQVAIDLVILAQVWLYSSPSPLGQQRKVAVQ